MSNTPPLRVAIWAAVSSKPQASEDKTSLQDQEAAGREFAAALGAQAVAVYQVAHTPGWCRPTKTAPATLARARCLTDRVGKKPLPPSPTSIAP
jgi:hypothetical protein